MLSETQAKQIEEKIRAKFGPCDVTHEGDRVSFCVPTAAVAWLVHNLGAGYVFPAPDEGMLVFVLVNE